MITKLLDSTLGTTVLENIVRRNGKKHRGYYYPEYPTQADHNSGRSQYSHIFFILLSCFSCGKFEKTFLTCSAYKPGLKKIIKNKNFTHLSLIWHEV